MDGFHIVTIAKILELCKFIFYFNGWLLIKILLVVISVEDLPDLIRNDLDRFFLIYIDPRNIVVHDRYAQL